MDDGAGELTDPVADPRFPRITAYDPQHVPEWPAGCSASHLSETAVPAAAIVDITDYSRSAADRGWGPGWEPWMGDDNDLCAARGDMAIVTADRSGTKISVRKAIAVLVDTLMDWTESAQGGNFRLQWGKCGGYNCRRIAGTEEPSNHSWGLAIDLNTDDNPRHAKPDHTIPDAVAQTWKRYGFAWGGDYHSNVKDWMHFEFMGTRAQAAECTRAALRDLSASTPPPRPEHLHRGSVGRAVIALQEKLNLNVPDLAPLDPDGDFGPGTEAAVREFQRRSTLTEDGVVGPNTWSALGLP